jgi:predicted ferric reductase
VRPRPLRLAAATAAVATAVGFVTMHLFGALHVGRMLPWVVGRGLGIAGYLSLVVLTSMGLWLRHPWRLRWRRPPVEAQVRLHAALAAVTLVLVVGHVIALAVDSYAGVGWRGAVVPGAATYRPVAVALGTVGMYLGVLIGASAALAGRVAGRAWLPIHRLAALTFGVVWLHGVVAGIDTGRLSALYLGTGGLVIALAVSRRLAGSPAPEAVGGAA